MPSNVIAPRHHDDVIKSKHFPRYWALCAGNLPVTGESPHKGQWRGALMFSFIFAWTNSWVNNGDAGDLRRNRCHYDVIVMGPSSQNEQGKAIAVAFVPCPTVARGVGYALMVRWDLYCANSTSIHCFRKRIAYNLHLMTSYSLWNISIRHSYRYMSLFLRQQKYTTQKPERMTYTLTPQRSTGHTMGHDLVAWSRSYLFFFLYGSIRKISVPAMPHEMNILPRIPISPHCPRTKWSVYLATVPVLYKVIIDINRYLKLAPGVSIVTASNTPWIMARQCGHWCPAVPTNTTRIYDVKFDTTGKIHISLTHWGRDKMAAIPQTTLSNAFSWTKMLEFRWKFQQSVLLRVQLTIFQH